MSAEAASNQGYRPSGAIRMCRTFSGAGPPVPTGIATNERSRPVADLKAWLHHGEEQGQAER